MKHSLQKLFLRQHFGIATSNDLLGDNPPVAFVIGNKGGLCELEKK